jgi:RNA chaperone Hfq
MDGSDFEGRIKNFDRFAVIVEQDGADHMIFKHAIAAIRTPRPVANYFSAH